MNQLSAAIEAILFSSNRPLRLRELQQATDSDRLVVEGALEELRESLSQRGLMLQRQQDLVGLVSPRNLPFLVRNDLLGAFREHPTTFLIHHEKLASFTDPIVRHRWFRRRWDEVHREAMRSPGEALVVYRRNGVPY